MIRCVYLIVELIGRSTLSWNQQLDTLLIGSIQWLHLGVAARGNTLQQEKVAKAKHVLTSGLMAGRMTIS